ncbi:MAG: nucleotide exchange factor GrpE [bacterium]|nr:nucleotide exchange factor GrpE [bacterium]
MTSEINKEIKKEEAPPAEDLKKLLEDCQKQRNEYLAGWQRARADFLNYKKEEVERFKEIINFAGEEMILKILPLLDNFYLAEKNLPEDLKENQYVQGLLQIKAQFEDLLRSHEVELIESLGKKFDPQFHEVVEEIQDKSKEPGTIVEETQKGYLIQGQLLRPAKVKVSNNTLKNENT